MSSFPGAAAYTQAVACTCSREMSSMRTAARSAADAWTQSMHQSRLRTCGRSCRRGSRLIARQAGLQFGKCCASPCCHATGPNPCILLLLWCAVIVKASSGPRYVVGCRNKVDKAKLTTGTRVALDMTTLTIMRALPREVGCAAGGGCLTESC